MTSFTFSLDKTITALEKLTKEDLKPYISAFQNRYTAETVVFGNTDAQYARSFGHDVTDNFQLKSSVANYIEMKTIPKGLYGANIINGNEIDSNCAVDVYIELGPVSNDRIRLLAEILDAPLGQQTFDVLRTKETLGYIAQGFAYKLNNIMYLRFIVVSGKFDAKYLSERVL